ncbi:hypothetical protein J3F83DRAFT_276873 [Trichoderma novae-zelandiae]
MARPACCTCQAVSLPRSRGPGPDWRRAGNAVRLGAGSDGGQSRAEVLRLDVDAACASQVYRDAVCDLSRTEVAGINVCGASRGMDACPPEVKADGVMETCAPLHIVAKYILVLLEVVVLACTYSYVCTLPIIRRRGPKVRMRPSCISLSANRLFVALRPPACSVTDMIPPLIPTAAFEAGSSYKPQANRVSQESQSLGINR